MSPNNVPTVRALSASHPVEDHSIGITEFPFLADIRPEDRFLDYVGTIDLHHGRYSSNVPYTVLEVIGAQLTTNVREALCKFGFEEFLEHIDGFTARRSAQEAAKERE